MLVIFAAFKKEATDLIKLVKFKKTVKNKNTVIYDGTIKNKRIIICITGMGKTNSLSAARLIMKMNLKNPVFIIQGISGALVDYLEIGDLIFYESVKNLEQFHGKKQVRENNAWSTGVWEQNKIIESSSEHYEKEQGNINILHFPCGLESKDTWESKYCLNDFWEFKSVLEVLNANFDMLKNKWESSAKNSRVYKSSGGLVSYVVTDHMEKNVLNELHDVEAIDMESYYIADIAHSNKIPVICIRSVSDNLSEHIPDLISKFGTGNFYFRFRCLANTVFSKSKAKSVIISWKNINTACRNLNQFVEKILLPYFGYKS